MNRNKHFFILKGIQVFSGIVFSVYLSEALAAPVASTRLGATGFEKDRIAVVNREENTSRALPAVARSTFARLAVNPATTQGAWSLPISWPIIAIHMVLNPDGTVLSFGTDSEGQQGAQLFYDSWNPDTGVHKLLRHTTRTDLFCATQILIPSTGSVLIGGGDTRGANLRDSAGKMVVNTGVNDVNIFNYKDLSLTPSSMPMTFARWYASLTTLPDGRLLIDGGIDRNGADVKTPEIFTLGQGWRTVPGIQGGGYYPRTFVMPNGQLLVFRDVDPALYMFNLSTGSSTKVGQLPSFSRWYLPALMYDRGKILAVRREGAVSIIDVNGNTPVVSESEAVGNNRYWSSGTVLPDGKVLLTGGGGTNAQQQVNTATNVALNAMIWDPKTGKWTNGASAKYSREYHSAALLLPDASVLVAGGGAPGPFKQLNAEVYYPPYLFNQEGALASRPVIQNAANTMTLGSNYNFNVVSALPISRVTLIKTGAVTHSYNNDSRFLEMPFRVNGNTISVSVNESSNVLTPGYYMVFVIDSKGVPSVAKIVNIPPSVAVAPSTLLKENFDSFAGNNRVGYNGSSNVSGSSILLSAARANATGSVFNRAPADINRNTSFSTMFKFRSSGAADSGMAFVIQGNNSNALGTGSHGVQGLARSLAVALEAGNKISIYSNGSTRPLASAQLSFNIKDAREHLVWVDYDSMQAQLKVYVRRQSSRIEKPLRPVLTTNVNLASILGNRAYIGFTSGSGQSANANFLDSWSLIVGRSPAKNADRLLQNESLFPNQSLISEDRDFKLMMQNDGNLVLYYINKNINDLSDPLWSSSTDGRQVAHAIMQPDGNMVLYDIKNTAIFATNTANSFANALILQNDGNVVVYKGRAAIWATNTVF